MTLLRTLIVAGGALAIAGAAQAEESGKDDLWHSGHAYRICAEYLSGADLCRGFETGAGEPAIDTLRQLDLFFEGRTKQIFADAAIMGIGERDETGIRRLSDQRVGAGEGDMVVQHHQPARLNIGAQ